MSLYDSLQRRWLLNMEDFERALLSLRYDETVVLFQLDHLTQLLFSLFLSLLCEVMNSLEALGGVQLRCLYLFENGGIPLVICQGGLDVLFWRHSMPFVCFELVVGFEWGCRYGLGLKFVR